MEKKYFLKDSELKSVDDDFFRHQDVTNNILRILRNNEPPYNIAIIGKWGLGKSSLINMVLNAIEKEPDKYTKVQINAWKYEKEVLGRVFLRQVLQGLDSRQAKLTTQEKIKTEFINVIKGEKDSEKNKNGILHKIKFAVKKYSPYVIFFAIITFIAYVIYKMISYACAGTWPDSWLMFLGYAITGYCKNIGVVLFIPLFLGSMTQLLKEIREKELEKVEVSIPDISVEDYEILVEKKIKETVGNNKDYKIVIVLDDLDRLSIPKMVEALDAIKMFINFRNCIFIVPFDDAILKSAIKNTRLKNINDNGMEIQSELMLDKLFQFKIYLPQLLKYDIKKYSVELCKRDMKDFVMEYCNNDWKLFERILRNILIHSNVQTPRQVKKIVNIFASNQMIAYGREKVGSTEIGFASTTKGMCIIAKLSVLQADFNEFYDLLFIYPDAIERTLEAYNNNEKLQSLPMEIKNYFGITNESAVFPKQAISLINFLNKTAKYQANSILSYLYMAMDDISIKTGSQKQQEFMKMVTSGNVVGTRDYLDEMPELLEAAIRFIYQEDDIYDIKNTVFCLLSVFDVISDVQKEKLVSAIADRADEISKNMYIDDESAIDFSNLLKGYILCQNKSEYAKILHECIGSECKDRVLEKLTPFMEHIDIMDDSLVSETQKHIGWVLANIYIEPIPFIELKKRYKGANDLWITKYYKFLVTYLIDNADYEEDIINELQATFLTIATNENINTLFAEMQELFSVVKLTEMFSNILNTKIGSQISEELVVKLIDEQIANADGNEAIINKLLTRINYDEDKGQIEKLDEYLLTQTEDSNFGKIIIQYCLKNSISNLNNTISQFISNLFEEISSDRLRTLEEIFDFLSEEQRKIVYSNLSVCAKYAANKNYKSVQSIFAIYAQNHWEEIHPLIIEEINYMCNYTIDSKYVYFLSGCIKEVAKKLSDEEITKYLEGIKKKVNNGTIVDAGIYAIYEMSQYMSDEYFVSVCPILTEQLSVDNCQEICEIMVQHSRLVTTENDNTGGYIKANLLLMENDNYINNGIKNLKSKFNYISSSHLQRLVEIVTKSDNVDMKIASETIQKFIDNKEIKDATSDILSLLKNNQDCTLVDESIRNCKKNTVEKVLTRIIDLSGEYEKESIFTMTRFLIRTGEKNENEKLQKLISIGIAKCEIEDDFLTLVELIQKIRKEQYLGCSKMYVDPFCDIITKTTSSHVRNKIILKAKELRIFKEIVKKVDEPTKKEMIALGGKNSKQE